MPKRKSFQETIADVAESEHHVKVKVAEINAKARTEHELNKVKYKEDAKVEIECMKLFHRQEESECQYQHELNMLERWIELERAQQACSHTGYPSAAPQGPVFSHPFDPSLS